VWLLYKERTTKETRKAGAPEEGKHTEQNIILTTPKKIQGLKSTLLNLTAESATAYCPTHYPEIKGQFSFNLL